ncbi:MAG TPA: DUF1697 domain-containing protein [Flavobacteriia bacterium]|nr:DUF1697 domain-containing protein [Flavobacteriia bacterium]
MMKTYICLLRGINVSGHKIIKMAALRDSFEGLGFENTTTYIQSGNIVFKSNKNGVKELQKIIHQMLLNDYGFDITVIVLRPHELKKASENNPFEKDSTKDPKKFYIVFLQEQPHQENIEKLLEVDYRPEEFVIGHKTIYFYAANGAHKSKMGNNFFENKLKVKATSRNWRTVQKLLEMTRQAV